ncbi:MAG: DUF429 domain-containing protein [Deltaproteobacteria bacterium]|nr:DUF429 domain-containing protein [Deltaproteobacteria bacterium]
MRILSVDLAYKRWSDIGVAVLGYDQKYIKCRFIDLCDNVPDPPTADKVAANLCNLSDKYNCKILLLDGPQAWKHPENGHEHARDCERILNTPAKTGLPGSVKPRNYLRFVCFSIDVFNYLGQDGFRRLRYKDLEKINKVSIALESFPLAAWRSLGVTPLPAKSKCNESHIRSRVDSLLKIFPIEFNESPNHDQLQAVVAGLAGIAIRAGISDGFEAVGQPPVSLSGIWQEGYIVNPKNWETGKHI